MPTGAQNFWEWMVEGLYNFLESVIGTHLVKKTFWFFATIFIFILFLNWFGLIPGVGTVGWGHHDPVTNAFHVDRPLLRGAKCRSQYDLRDGGDFLCALDRLGAAGKRCWRIHPPPLRTER